MHWNSPAWPGKKQRWANRLSFLKIQQVIRHIICQFEEPSVKECERKDQNYGGTKVWISYQDNELSVKLFLAKT